MRKVLISVFILSAFLLFTDCGPKPAAFKEDCPIPDFITNPPASSDAFYGTGDAVKTQLALATQAADGRARTAVARAAATTVQANLQDYLDESGIGKDARALEWTGSVANQVTNVVLKGAVVVERKICPEGGKYHCYSLVKYPLKSLIDETVKILDNEVAAFNEFKAKQGIEELKKTIREMKPSG